MCLVAYLALAGMAVWSRSLEAATVVAGVLLIVWRLARLLRPPLYRLMPSGARQALEGDPTETA